MAEVGVHDNGWGGVVNSMHALDAKDSATGGTELTLLPLALDRC